MINSSLHSYLDGYGLRRSQVPKTLYYKFNNIDNKLIYNRDVHYFFNVVKKIIETQIVHI